MKLFVTELVIQILQILDNLHLERIYNLSLKSKTSSTQHTDIIIELQHGFNTQ